MHIKSKSSVGDYKRRPFYEVFKLGPPIKKEAALDSSLPLHI